MGDIIYSLPVIKAKGKGNIYISPNHNLEMKMKSKNLKFFSVKQDGSKSGIDKAKFEFIKDLLEKQTYISSAFYEDLKCGIDLDLFRSCSIFNTTQERYIKKFDVPKNIYNKPWLIADKIYLSKVIFSRTKRYQNKLFPWTNFVKQYPEALFLGTSEEYKDFCEEFGEVKFHKSDNALELANIINACELFIGNQSFLYSVAESLKKQTIQETCVCPHDCLFPRNNATYFIHGKLEKITLF